MSLNFFFPESFSPVEGAEITELVKAGIVGRFMVALSRTATERLNISSFSALFRVLSRMARQPGWLEEWGAHWEVAFLMEELAQGEERRNAALHYLSRTLLDEQIPSGEPLLENWPFQSVLDPFERLSGWNVPLLGGEFAGLLIARKLNASSTPAMAEGLARAHQIVRCSWPDTLPWFELLMPAIADIGDPLELGSSYSGSLGPGMPICLSSGHQPLHYAENLVHELQHQRFLLAVPFSRWFPRWRDKGFISPYRPDPRPLSGLHLGLHAFLAVNELRLRALEQAAVPAVDPIELLRTHRQNLFAFRTLVRHEDFNTDAAQYWSAIAACLKRHSLYIEQLVDSAAKRHALTALDKHVTGVLRLAPNAKNTTVSMDQCAPDEWSTTAQPLLEAL